MRVVHALGACTALAAMVAAGQQGRAADIKAGRHVFQTVCVACHGVTGKGLLPGMPDFAQPGGVLSQPDSVLLHRIEHGFKSPASPIAMPPKGGDSNLTTQDLKDVLAYLHQEFGVASKSASEAPSGGQGKVQPDSGGSRTMQPGATGQGMGSGMMGRGNGSGMGGNGNGSGMMGGGMNGRGMMGR